MEDVNTILSKIRALREQGGSSNCPESSDCEGRCPVCDGRGYLFERDAAGVCHSWPCRCEIKRVNQLRIEKSGLSGVLARSSFENYRTDEPWQASAKETAVRYLRDWRGKWFFIGGAVGAGKTHLCAAICGKLMEAGVDVRWFRWRDDAVRIKSVVGDAGLYADEVEPLKRVKVLYIDDFLKGGRTEADRNLAFEILNARYNDADTATLISSELTIEQIIDWDEGIGSRIFERANGFTVGITGSGKNYRLRGQ